MLCTVHKTKTWLYSFFLKANIIPPEKLVSPVADAVRKKLATVAWGRKKLGLPVMVRYLNDVWSKCHVCLNIMRLSKCLTFVEMSCVCRNVTHLSKCYAFVEMLRIC